MQYYRIELNIKFGKEYEKYFTKTFEKCFFEYELIQDSNFESGFAHRFMLYPQEWIKYENAKQDGYIWYTYKYKTPTELFEETFDIGSIKITNPYNGELIYQRKEIF